jgi:hypothetical protein
LALTLEESARLTGQHRWCELRLFSILGGWVATASNPEARLLLDRHSQHHAWRAQQWWDRLPVPAGLDREALVVPPSPGAEEAAETLAGREGNPARLAGAYRFALPRLAVAYRHHLSLTGPVADGSVIRTLELVGSDLERDWREGEALLQKHLGEVAAVKEAADTVALLELLLLG